MDFITKTLKRPARIAALGLLSLFLAAPSALADEIVQCTVPKDLSNPDDNSGKCGSHSPASVTLTAEGQYADFTATPAAGYVFKYWQNLNNQSTTSDNPLRVAYSDSIDLLQIRAWFAPTYDVTLNPCGGVWQPDDTNLVRVIYGETYGELDSPTRYGYSFVGWFTQSSGGEQVTASTTVTSASAHTLYAHWNGDESTLTFNPNGGTFADPGKATRTVAYGSPYGALPGAADVSKPGNSLYGWLKVLGDRTTRISASAIVYETSAFTVYAEWIPANYTVAFDGNGATSGSMEPVSCKYGDPDFTLPANKFRFPGHEFLGWNTKADGTGNYYADQEKNSTLATTDGATVTLYAQWRESGYVVAFDGGSGGEGEMPPVSFPRDVESNLPSNAFVRVGYVFAGWNDSLNATVHADGAAVLNLAPEETTNTIVATWAPVDYTVSFKRGAATAKGEMDDLPCVYDSPTNLPPCTTITNPLGAFLGWALDPKANKPDFLDKAVVTNLATTVGAVVPLYAVWDSELTDLSRAIGCDTLRLESTGDNRWTVHTNDAGEVSLMSGYKSGSNQSWLTTTANGPGTLSFEWCVSGPPPAEYWKTATTKGVSINGSPSAVAKDTTAANNIATNVWYVKNFSVPDGNELPIYWFSYAEYSSMVDEGRLFLRNVTWLPDADSNSVYTVRFDANGGSGEMADKTCLSGVAATLPSNSFTYADRDFDHWHDPLHNRDYPDGATVVDLAPGGSNTTLIAVWSSPTPPGPTPPGPTPPGPTPPDPPTTVYYTVTFDPNGGSVVETSRQVEEGDIVGELPAATRAGYTQEGWWTDPVAGDEISSNTVVSADATNYAHWAANEYTVTFDPNGGSVSPSSKLVVFDGEYGELPEPAREGDWDFAGWFDANGAEVTTNRIVDIASDHTATAYWTYTGPIQFSLKVGEYFKATMTELGYDVPTNGTVFSVVAKGLPSGLKLKYNAAVKNKKGKVTKKAKTEWWIEGVPTAALDYMTRPAYLVITVSGVTQTFDLPIEVLAQDVVVIADLALGQSINEQYYLPGVTKGWSVSGLPTGLKYTAKRVTKNSGKKTIVVAEAYSVYGKTAKAGLFTITAKKKKGAFYETMKFRVLVTPAAVDASRFGADLTNITTMAYVPVDWDLVWGGECGGATLPAVSSVGGKVAKVTGLPAGLSFAASYNKKQKQPAQTIVGKPTKTGTYVVTFTKNVKEKVNGKTKTVAKTAQILWKVVANSAALSLDFNTAGGVIEGGVVGLRYADLLAFAATSNATVTASGLPAGIKLAKLDDSGEYAFIGYTAKAGTYLVTVKATLYGKTVTQRVALKVEALPSWAKGTYNGFVADEDGGATNGLATVTVSAAGKISGKFYDRGTNWTVTAACYTGVDAQMCSYQFVCTNAVAKYAYKVKERVKVKGKWTTKTVTKYVTRSFTLTVGQDDDDELGGTATLSENGGDTTVYAWQNLWGSSAYKAVGRQLFYTSSMKQYKIFTIKGTDPAGVAMGLAEAMTLSLKVTPAGAVTATLSYGSAKYTCSTVVIPQTSPNITPFEGIAYLYFAPKGTFPGCFLSIPLPP